MILDMYTAAQLLFKVSATRNAGIIMSAEAIEASTVIGRVAAEERRDTYLKRSSLITSIRHPSSMLELRIPLFDSRLTSWGAEVITLTGFERVPGDAGEPFRECIQSWILRPVAPESRLDERRSQERGPT